ncbi:hypothetical protein ALC62_14602 [Cyphomyrmex costatus]|uniref:Uncharacterized protein n=1 Tax=Cyphomyrmex costatus TaxID=456900 RepID=A0A151I8K2_9HYME|nr:hypothetical protein ALC62_14602 [Cyphomyrmex costatus]
MVSGWCPCVPLGRRQSPTQQQQQQQQQQPPSSSRAPFTVSGATDRADMVQMFYYENRGKCCKKLLRYNGYPNKGGYSRLHPRASGPESIRSERHWRKEMPAELLSRRDAVRPAWQSWDGIMEGQWTKLPDYRVNRHPLCATCGQHGRTNSETRAIVHQ